MNRLPDSLTSENRYVRFHSTPFLLKVQTVQAAYNNKTDQSAKNRCFCFVAANPPAPFREVCGRSNSSPRSDKFKFSILHSQFEIASHPHSPASNASAKPLANSATFFRWSSSHCQLLSRLLSRLTDIITFSATLPLDLLQGLPVSLLAEVIQV